MPYVIKSCGQEKLCVSVHKRMRAEEPFPVETGFDTLHSCLIITDVIGPAQR